MQCPAETLASVAQASDLTTNFPSDMNQVEPKPFRRDDLRLPHRPPLLIFVGQLPKRRYEGEPHDPD